ncbi:MAG: NUMOD3 domain-containing DNA-binding protein [Roseomonas mucosa]|nr:NUMOD3 domain-containing DNA-binding protein [Roseomonas mucosa]
MRKAMIGEGNYFFGKTHTVQSREKMSASLVAANHSFRGKNRPDWLTQALLLKITGSPRNDSTKAKLKRAAFGRHRIFGYCRDKAASGKTSGKQGIFYIARINGDLKFGSATTTMRYRLTRLRQKHGPCVDLLVHCVVPDAGAYEAQMMEAFRHHWIHGERFQDFLSCPAP